jgi:RNA polymerase sigma-70 factor (ECF subfamily)
MTDRTLLTREFERHRTYLRSVALRMLGSPAEADDALQETWLRLDRRPRARTDDLRPWLTTVVGRICLDMLRARRVRREEPIVVVESTDTTVSGSAPAAGSRISPTPEPSPDHEVELADSVGLALLVVLENLSPAERIAFVLHDVFAIPFEEIATVVDRSPTAARQLASRARRRIHAARAEPDADRTVQRQVVDAFLAAAREGRFEALLALLDPDVVLRIDAGDRRFAGFPAVLANATREPIEGIDRVADVLRTGTPMFARLCRPALIDGRPGIVVGPPGKVIGVVAMTMAGGRIRSIDIVADSRKLRFVTEEQPEITALVEDVAPG